MTDSLLIELTEPGTNRRVMLEDDGRTGYACLFVADEIVSDVGLYNRVGVADDPSWDDRDDLPFPNKRKFIVKDDEGLLLSATSVVEARWDERGVDLFVDARLTARLEPSEFPGSSRLAAIDSLVARAFPRSKLRAV